MRYIAKSLDEIAVAFEKRGESAAKWAEATRTAADRKSSEVESRIWAEAAAFLRDVDLQVEPVKAGK